jgi:dTDP-glucose 4,6-dehydratase
MAQVTQFVSGDAKRKRPILVTGGAGFIGANFIKTWLDAEEAPVVNLDKLTYAGNLDNLEGLDRTRLDFVQGDIGDVSAVRALLDRIRPRAVINFAAESHVDRSIHGPDDFIATNVVGTFRLLECIRDYWQHMDAAERAAFRLVHVSTDEVYGSLLPNEAPFRETNAFQPNSPYAASKASSDHLMRAWYHTYGLPIITTNCSNNYGPFQFPEKLIPLMIQNALDGKSLPVYGDGLQIRDWLYVEDHCAAIRIVLRDGKPGDTYNIGGESEKTNIEVVQAICGLLEQQCPRADSQSYRNQIAFVKDRPGHDRRYAIDSSKIRNELGWRPSQSFESGLRDTIKWYVANRAWTARILSGSYRDWIHTNYSSR